MWLPWGGVKHPPLLPGLHLFNFTSAMNEWTLIKDAFLKPCFDTQPMPSISEIKYISNSPPTLYNPSPWPSTPQHICLCLHLLFYNDYPPTMQYNWLESETQCALMHSLLNSLRDCLWFNWLKRYWNLVLKWNALNHIPLLLPLLTKHHPPHITTSTSTSATFTSVKRNIALNSFSCIFIQFRSF